MFIGNLRYILLVEIDCGKLTSFVHNASDKHIGKYQSKENYHRKKQTKLREKINPFENSTFDIHSVDKSLCPKFLMYFFQNYTK